MAEVSLNPTDTADIVLVEDSESDAELCIRAFQKCDSTKSVFRAKDGQEAQEYLFATGAYAQRRVLKVPHVIFLDLKLPVVSGFEFLAILRADPRTKHIPVVILTSSGEPVDVEHCYELGANSYLVKPIEFDKYITRVSLACEYWLSHNLYPPDVPTAA